MINFIITMLFALVVGLIFYKLKVPGGLMIGAIFGVAILNIVFQKAYMPYEAKVLAQTVSGAFIGVGISREDLRNFKKVFKPMVILLMSMMTLNLVMGIIIYLVTDLDLLTSFFACVPGGMSDTPIIAADMGANGAQVALLQFVRMCAGIGVFPSFISLFGKNEANVNKGSMQIKKTPYSHNGFAVTVVFAIIGGILGDMLDIPAGTLLFSLIFTIIAKQIFTKCMLPIWVRRSAQVLAGAYIGTSVEKSDILGLSDLVLPAVLVLVGYFSACIIISRILKKHCAFTTREGMLCATPAGASDMALISADIGVTSADVVVIQIARLLFAVSVLPHIILFVSKILFAVGL